MKYVMYISDQIYQVNNHIVTTKIILISDMHPTDTCMYQGPDVADPRQLDEVVSCKYCRFLKIKNIHLFYSLYTKPKIKENVYCIFLTKARV